MTHYSLFPNFPHLYFQSLALCLCIICQGQEVAISSSDLERQDDLADLDLQNVFEKKKKQNACVEMNGTW